MQIPSHGTPTYYISTPSHPAKLSPRYHHRIPVPSGSPSAQNAAGPCPSGRSCATSLGNTAPRYASSANLASFSPSPVNPLVRAALKVT
ncbi:hypothetical protein PSPO01_03018 [Paraphaeosphaeria sporulosa]